MKNKKISICTIALGLSLFTMQAQQRQVPQKPQSMFPANSSNTQGNSDVSENLNTGSVLSDDSIYIPESLEEDVDNLLKSWHVNYYTKRDNNCLDFNHNIDPVDSVYVKRLARLPNIIEMPFNDPVRTCIKYYTERRRTTVQYMLGLADFYFPMIEQILDENGLPLEIKYLAIVESALNPTALSRAGACGLWQFMLPTGKIYGLEINSLVDERRNPVKATYAACRYLKEMYEIYGDWNLVIASYNCGPGNVNKAIRRAGGAKDYWAVYEYLPKETRMYVPWFIAATYAMNYHNEHNICPVATSLPLSTDTIVVNKMLHLDQIAQVLKIDIELLRALNPEFKKDIVPGEYKPYFLRLPTTHTYAFIEKEASIYDYNKDMYFPNRSYAGPGSTYLASNSSNKNASEKITHRVRKGETMLKIANHYGVTTTQIKKWNGLRSSKVATGRNLVLYIDNGGYSGGSSVATTSASSQSNNTQVASASENQKSGTANSAASYKRYKVKSGDSFYSIAKKHPGVDAKDLMRVNNMKSTGLKAGQVIKIPVV